MRQCTTALIRLSRRNLTAGGTLALDSAISVMTTETDIVDSLMEGQKGTIIVEKTPFYGTMGGQQGMSE